MPNPIPAAIGAGTFQSQGTHFASGDLMIAADPPTTAPDPPTTLLGVPPDQRSKIDPKSDPKLTPSSLETFLIWWY